MTGLLLVAGSIGCMLTSGFGVATALRWFNTFELNDIDNTKRSRASRKSGNPHAERIERMARQNRADF